MLTDKLRKRFFLISSCLLIILIVYIFPTKRIEYIDNNRNDYLSSYIYLIDNNNYVSRVNVVLTSSSDIDKIYEIIEYLTIDSNKCNYIKDGFYQIIPKGTRLLSVVIDNNIVKLNFSKEFLNIDDDSINNLISSIVYSITSLNDSYKISFYIDGNLLTNLPNNDVLDSLVDRSFGINKVYNLYRIDGSSQTTIYYLSKVNDYYYYVPITLVNNNNDDKIKIIIEEMVSKAIYQTNLISYLKNIKDINYEFDYDSLVINFNSNNFISDNLIEETIYTINLSLLDNYNLKEIVYYINNIKYDI